VTTLQDKGWTLAPAGDDDFEKLMTWFPDAASVDLWGGPNFRYPFTDASGQLAAFGQSYERTGRGHLARLISNPKMRRQGVPAYECYRSLGFEVGAYPPDAKMPDKCYFLIKNAPS
jgi:hypothetical protein